IAYLFSPRIARAHSGSADPTPPPQGCLPKRATERTCLAPRRVLRVSPDAQVFVPTDTFTLRLDEGSVMSVWAWILVAGGLVGLLGAALICAFVYECTTMKFRRWETLP